jgi:hypothetical protein
MPGVLGDLTNKVRRFSQRLSKGSNSSESKIAPGSGSENDVVAAASTAVKRADAEQKEGEKGRDDPQHQKHGDQSKRASRTERRRSQRDSALESRPASRQEQKARERADQPKGKSKAQLELQLLLFKRLQDGIKTSAELKDEIYGLASKLTAAAPTKVGGPGGKAPGADEPYSVDGASRGYNVDRLPEGGYCVDNWKAEEDKRLAKQEKKLRLRDKQQQTAARKVRRGGSTNQSAAQTRRHQQEADGLEHSDVDSDDDAAFGATSEMAPIPEIEDGFAEAWDVEWAARFERNLQVRGRALSLHYSTL